MSGTRIILLASVLLGQVLAFPPASAFHTLIPRPSPAMKATYLPLQKEATLDGASLDGASLDGALFTSRGGSISSPTFLNRYSQLLTTRPLLTRSITCAIITIIGDAIAQLMETKTLNPVRASAFFLSSLVFTGPFLHFWYDILWRFKSRLSPSLSDKKRTLLTVLLDQSAGVLLFFPAYFLVFDVCESICSGSPRLPTAALGKLSSDLPAILKNQYKLWPLANYLNFSIVPEQMRPLVGNLISLFWNIYLCAAVAK